MNKLAAILVALALCVASLSGVQAQEDEYDMYDDVAELDGFEEEEASAGFMYTHPGVDTTVLFQTHPDKQLPPGERIDLLVGFQNHAETEFNVTHVFASLVHANDFSFYVENYTVFEYGVGVGPAEEATLTYVFWPNENFDPREFGLTVMVYYSDIEGNMFVSPAYNSTISIVDPVSIVDASTMFTYVAIGLVIATAVYLYYFSNDDSKSSTEAPSFDKKEGVKIDDATIDFLPAHLKKKVVKKSSKKKKAKK